MISYAPLIKELEQRGLKRSDLAKELGISSRTIAKIARGEKLSRITLTRIADFLDLESEELYRTISSNPILQLLRDEKSAGISGGLYHELQVRMTYNSNHIEGSRLSEEQTRQIFETRTIGGEDAVSIDDILETVNHFRAVDYVIDTAEEVLSEAIIKRIHCILKHDTKDSEIDWFNVGDYKKRANTVGGIETTRPEDVPGIMKSLLGSYNSISHVTIDDIIAFHAEFELVHPFQDGNGRVGRLIALKECLAHGLIPFLIEDSKKFFYYRGLSRWREEKAWLRDTCLDGQDTFSHLLDIFGIPHS